MNIIKEISHFENYVYTFEGDDRKNHTVILGGFGCPRYEDCKYKLPWDDIIDTLNEMEKIYQSSNLTVKDKTDLGRKLIRMRDYCFTRLPGTHTLEEQSEYIAKLSDNERCQIEKQVQMYKDCRQFHADYIYR